MCQLNLVGFRSLAVAAEKVIEDNRGVGPQGHATRLCPRHNPPQYWLKPKESLG